jgi:NadR type nicotinamide-nucleotide adenylyltransferase
MVKRIAITGPESTGKSQLAEALALHYATVWVQEYARNYIERLNRPYTYDDILIIAREQLKNENDTARNANQLLFCDSDFTVTKIWCEFKYQKCHAWIIDQFKSHQYDLYLLCDVDIPWEPDPQREHPEHRNILFSYYKNELASAHYNFRIVSGMGEKRLNNAIRFIEESLIHGIK